GGSTGSRCGTASPGGRIYGIRNSSAFPASVVDDLVGEEQDQGTNGAVVDHRAGVEPALGEEREVLLAGDVAENLRSPERSAPDDRDIAEKEEHHQEAQREQPGDDLAG